jgi:hypothetical protein
MKKLFFGMLLASVMGMFFACQKDSLSTATDLINTIANADSKQLVQVEDLSSNITGYVSQNYAPVSVEAAWHVSKAGYEVALEDGQVLYFNERHHFLGGDDGSGHPHGQRRCMRGNEASVNDLPAAATQHITDNFPGETVELVKIKLNGFFAVKLSGGGVLLFDADGAFIRECGEMAGPGEPGSGPGGGHPCGCMYGDTLTVDDLAPAAADFIATEYPDETIAIVVLKASGKWAVELGDGTVLLFDADGVFIKECGVTEPGSGPWGPWNHNHHGGHGGHGGHHGGGGMGPGGGPGGPVGPGGMGGTQINVDELPQLAKDYIAANYPDSTVEFVVLKNNGKYFVKMATGEKLLFDADGNILFDSGN